MIDINKTDFIQTLSQVDRERIPELIEFLKATDFFTAPASHRFNSAYDGGLCRHSLTVYYNLTANAFHIHF